MKIAILNDTHFGARSDSQLFADYFGKFFKDIFFPYCEENGIDTILHLGDFLDRRKFVNFNTLKNVRENFIDSLDKNDMQLHCLLGNHDTFYKNTNDLNSLNEVFSNHPRFHVYEEPIVIELGGCRFGLVPWINTENKKESVDFINTCDAPILCGHFELDGYQVMRGVKHESWMTDEMLRRFEMVLSGHYHCKQSKNNVHYLGTQYQITFSDLDDQKGFHVFDTETRELEFVPNPYEMFYVFQWDDKSDELPQELCEIDADYLQDSYVKVFVEAKTKPYLFDRFLDRLYNSGVANITIVDATEINFEVDEEVDMKQDTLSLIYETIDNMTDVEDKSKLKDLVKQLYMESLSL